MALIHVFKTFNASYNGPSSVLDVVYKNHRLSSPWFHNTRSGRRDTQESRQRYKVIQAVVEEDSGGEILERKACQLVGSKVANSAIEFRLGRIMHSPS